MSLIDTLKALAITVRNEKKKEANSAVRIGDLFIAIIDFIKSVQSGEIRQDGVDTYNYTSGGKISLLNKYPNPELNWTVLVRNDETNGDKASLYKWNGANWINLETVVYTDDVATKEDVSSINKGITDISAFSINSIINTIWFADKYVVSLPDQPNYGQEGTLLGARCTDFIRILPNQVIICPVTINGNVGIVFYDKNKIAIPDISLTAALLNNEFTSPDDNRLFYVRVGDRSSNDIINTPSIKYKYSIPNRIDTVKTESIAYTDTIAKIIDGIFRNITWKANTYIASLSDQWNFGKEVAYAGFRCTDFIPVLSNKTIIAPVIISSNVGIVFYDKDKIAIPDISITTTLVNNEFYVPDDDRIAFFRVSDRTKGTIENVPTIKYKGSISEDINKVNQRLDINIGLADFETEQLNKRLIDSHNSNPFVWKALPKAYFSFTHDDANEFLPEIWETMQQYNFPFCPAVPPFMLNTIYNGKTVKEICQEIINSGGEILSHGSKVLTSSSKMSDYISVFRDQKLDLSKEGFDVNGIILNGGTGSDTIDYNISQAMCLRYYQYSDLYGTTPQYTLQRFRKTSLAERKAVIDDAILNKKWIRFFMHNFTEVTKSDLIAMFDYLKEKQNSGEIEFVTWKYMYDTYKSTELDHKIDMLN